MKKFEEQIQVDARPSTIFDVYRKVESWSEWDHGVKYAHVSQFESGAKGELKPSAGPTFKMTLPEVVEGKSFSSAFRLPLCEMRLDYRLTPVGDRTTLVTHSVTFDGKLGSFFGNLFSRGIRRDLPGGLARLKEIAEREQTEQQPDN